jgi:hypothetical protein
VKSIISKQRKWRIFKGTGKPPQLGKKVEKSKLKHLKFKSENLNRNVSRNSHIYVFQNVRRRNHNTIMRTEDVKLKK